MGDRVGQQFGNYRLVRMIGQGSFADVYLGEHIHLYTQAAIKVLQLRLVGSSTEQFRTEARTIAGLIHPNIVRVLDFGLEDGLPFLVMDYAPNGTLRRRHTRGIPLPSTTVVTYVRQIAAALQYAHDRKLIHRDVKPENLLVGREQEVLLSDFGLVLIAQSSGSRSLQEMSGTVAYMAPEQLQGRPRQASDQYSLGIIVYEWLSGNRPFNGTFTELASQHMLVPPPPLYGRIPGVSAAVEEVIQNALAKDPHQRFASVQAFATALEQAYQKPAQKSFMPSELAASLSGSTYVEQPLEPPVQPPEQISSHYQQMEPVALARGGMVPAEERPTEMISSGERITSPWDKAIPPRTRPPAQREERQRSTAGKLLLLTMLALLIIAGGLGSFYFVNASAKSRADATATAVQATAHAQGALGAHATLTANAQATGIANATATASIVQKKQNLYTQVTSQTPTFSDPLSNNSNGIWNAGRYCSFTGGAYHVSTVTSNSASFCYSNNPIVVRNYAFQVQMTIVKGAIGGINGGFLLLSGDKQYYGNSIGVGLDGSYAFGSYLPTPGSNPPTSQTSAFHEGLGQTNQITVIAGASEIDVYINGLYVVSTTRNFSYSSSFLVFFANSDTAALVEVAYSDAKLWNL